MLINFDFAIFKLGKSLKTCRVKSQASDSHKMT